MKKKLPMLAMACIISSGCAVGFKEARYTPIIPTQEIIYDSEVGVLNTRRLGDAIITKEILPNFPGFITESEIKLPNIRFTSIKSIPAGTKLKAIYQYENGRYYCQPNIDIISTNSIDSSLNTKICFIVEPTGQLNGLVACMSGSVAYPNEFKEMQHIYFKPTTVRGIGNFRQEILYIGKQTDNIRFQYREFKDDFERPAFSQELTYNLTESNILTYKNFRFEVTEATNSIIRYTLLSK